MSSKHGMTEILPGVYVDQTSGEIGVDEDEVLDFAGELEDEFGDDEDDEFGDDEDDEFGDDDDELGDDDEGEEVGRGLFARLRARKRRKRAARRRRRGRGRGRGRARPGRRRRPAAPRRSTPKPKASPMIPAVLAGDVTVGAAGATTITIRAQSKTFAEDLVLSQTAGAGAEVTSIMFGDNTVFNTPNGVDVDVFKTDSTLRKLLKGQVIEAGTDVIIAVSFAAAGTAKATIVGKRPAPRGC